MNKGLILENVSYKEILKNVNLSLDEGSISVLMGATGSGKTTLLKSIFGLIDFEGTLSLNGTIITKDNINDLRKNFGIYLGRTDLSENIVFSNIIEPLENLNIEEVIARGKVYDISKKLGIDSLLYKEMYELSYSQKKMVSLARTLITEPKVILIDNIFESLDTYYKSKVRAYLNHLKKSKKHIVIFATNNSEDLSIATNLIIMNNGKIVVNDEVNKLVEDENIFSKNNIKLPFLFDLSHKLMSYELIDHLINNVDEMVDEIWK